MRTLLKVSANSFFALALVYSVAATVTAAAGEREARVISARAGGVNHVAGDVMFKRAGESEWRQLTRLDDLKSGDSVRTGADGRAEVLLNPGSFFRLAENSEVELTDASLERLRLRLARGSAIVEAMGYGPDDLSIIITTPHARATIIRSGVYRFNVLGQDSSEIIVQKGRALLGEDRPVELQEGRAARVTRAGGTEIAKWNKKGRDTFDLWSRERAEELARVNGKLQRRNVSAMLANANLDGLFGAGNFPFAGVWLHSPPHGCYTFVPFMYGWGSPYGYFYNSRFWMPNCRPCHRQPIFNDAARRGEMAGRVGYPNPPNGFGPPSTKHAPPRDSRTPSGLDKAPKTPMSGSGEGGGRTPNRATVKGDNPQN